MVANNTVTCSIALVANLVHCHHSSLDVAFSLTTLHYKSLLLLKSSSFQTLFQ